MRRRIIPDTMGEESWSDPCEPGRSQRTWRRTATATQEAGAIDTPTWSSGGHAPIDDHARGYGHARILGLADLYARAGYFVPNDLPSFHVYLPAKYRQLPPEAVARLVELFEKLAAKHDLQHADPVLATEGADE